MKTRQLVAAATILALLLPASATQATDGEQPIYDLVLRGGRILDGAGNPWVQGDLAVRGNKIAAIGHFAGTGTREIDVGGRFIAPGFVDMMDQSGAVLLREGTALNKLHMGVTTLIAGEAGTPVEASQIDEYFRRLEAQGIAVNFGTYYAAVQARRKVMGDKSGAPSAKQLSAMRHQVRTALDAGAFGIATALIYPPDSFQSTSDLVEMAKEAGKCSGFYATHMRNESADLIEAIDEAIAIGEASGAKVEIFHLKAAYAPLWGKLMPRALGRIEAARERGVDIAANIYPYRAGGTYLPIVLPNWVWEEGENAGYEKLQDSKIRARIKDDIRAGSHPGWSNLVEASGGWENVKLASAFSRYEEFNQQSIAAIARKLGKDPEDVAIEMILAAHPKVPTALFFMMDEHDIEAALQRPWVSIGSDAAAVEKLGDVDDLGLPHPRSYGTFPKVIAEYVTRRGTISLPDAVRKMTSWPAARMGLEDRGLLRTGLQADIVVFDLATLDDVASWEQPNAVSKGIEFVVVNGVIVLDNGSFTGALPGKVLKGACAK
jgi:N-acyl-D-amino-acid deacylase